MSKFAWVYAALDPQERSDVPNANTPDFLTPLWRAQTPVNERPKPKAVIAQNLDSSITALTKLITDHPDPIGAFQIATNLLTAAGSVAYLKENLKSADFVRELVGLAFQQAKYNDTSSIARNVYGEQLQMALDLLAAGDTSQQAKGALAQAFKFLTTTEQKVKLIHLVGNLMEVIHQVPALQEAGGYANWLEARDTLIPLATAYMALNPTGSAAAGDPLKFLETLAQPHTAATISQGTSELQTFLADTTTHTQRRTLLETEVKLLKAAKQVQLTSSSPELRQQMDDVSFINKLAELAKPYTAFTFAQDQPPLDFFLDTLYRAQTTGEINQGATQLDAFLRDPSNPGLPMFGADAAKRVKLMDFTADLLKAAKQVPVLSYPAATTPTIKE